MNHKQKLKLARKLRTQKEHGRKVPVFQTDAWTDRKKANSKKLKLK